MSSLAFLSVVLRVVVVGVTLCEVTVIPCGEVASETQLDTSWLERSHRESFGRDIARARGSGNSSIAVSSPLSLSLGGSAQWTEKKVGKERRRRPEGRSQRNYTMMPFAHEAQRTEGPTNLRRRSPQENKDKKRPK